MNHKYIYNLESAFEAEKNNQLFDWAQSYLRGEGWNKGLADNIVEEKPTILILKEFPLKKLKRIMGPEKEINYPEDLRIWEQRIEKLVTAIKNGVQFPPLIVTDFWKDLEIADGSHRQEALLRFGYENYWTIFFFKREESKSLLQIT